MQIYKLHSNKIEKEYQQIFEENTGNKCVTFHVGNQDTRSAAIGDFDGNFFI